MGFFDRFRRKGVFNSGSRTTTGSTGFLGRLLSHVAKPKVILLIVLYTAAFVGAVKLADILLGVTTVNRGVPGLDITEFTKTIRTLELYPFTGWHMQSRFTHKGPMTWEDNGNRNYDVRTGSKGFFIDFELDHPPEKLPNEYRIILIGGSGAQGWGALTNELMLYKQLEKRLNAHSAKDGSPRRFRVINMAMGSSITYQNYIALNLWGHKLKPDLILSYSGRNDWYIPIVHENAPYSHYYFNELLGLTHAARSSSHDGDPGLLYRFLPNIMGRTNIGIAEKMLFDYGSILEKAKADYRKETNATDLTPKELLNRHVTPFHAKALKSIKRDFNGIPIMLAWQAMSPTKLEKWEKILGDDFYNIMYEKTRNAVQDYMNDRWYCVNVHKLLETDPKPYIGTHLGDRGHELVSEMLADRIHGEVLQ